MTSPEDDRLVCRCEEVTLGQIEQAIDEGATTLNEVKRSTRAGMGLCQSRTCSRLVAGILARKTGKTLQEILPVTVRPPVRPIELSVFETGNGDETDC